MVTKEDLFQEEKGNVEYTLDWYNMIFGNIFNVPLLAIVIYGIVQLINIAQSFETEQLKVLALVSILLLAKSILLSVPMPRIFMRERNKRH